MINVMLPESRGLYAHWFEVMRSMALGNWRLLNTQYQVGLDLLKALRESKEEPETGQAPPPPDSKAEGGLRDLEARALERVRKGFPPPPEVYEAQNRSRIDWSRFPEWAWPTDPELFTGTSHEG
ncbi:MAG TPA: hypothetical protein VKD72_25920 [Gemmataceae bacterium]|nr:hypothetical protein [Gemmataceae bacterium]